MKLTIVCLSCDHRNPVARKVEAPEVVRIVCHACEQPIKATITAADLIGNRTRVTA